MADTTHVGIVGLGKMGGNMRERMRTKGLTVTGYDPNPEVSDVDQLSDLVIDGGNTRFTDDEIHRTQLATREIAFVDVGVSGGIWGLENGYGLMAGGDVADIERAMSIFDALRPEGFELLDRHKDLVKDVPGSFKAWQRGTVVRSCLELLVKALEEDPDFARFVSRQEDSPSMKAVAALRNQFGGHSVRKS